MTQINASVSIMLLFLFLMLELLGTRVSEFNQTHELAEFNFWSPNNPYETREVPYSMESDLTTFDWIMVQGGRPRLLVSDLGIHYIYHNYKEGNDLLVTTGKLELREYGYVSQAVSRGVRKQFPAIFLRAFHGEPCQTRSFQAGGSGYDSLEYLINYEGRTFQELIDFPLQMYGE